MKRIALAAAWLATALFFAVAAAASPGAKALEARLLAPCCWGGTLDMHDSPIARELNHEIEDRMAKGESADAIEDDLVSRYGERIRALPKGDEGVLETTVKVAFAGLGLSAIALVLYMRRLRKRGAASAAAADAKAPAAKGRDALDDRLDAELADL